MSDTSDHDRRVRGFIEKFFSPPNAISVSEIHGGRWSRIRPWAEDLRAEPPRATVLPCWTGDRVYWYALAFSEAQLSALRDDLLAFVGPTYSTFRGLREELDPANPVEAAVLELTGGSAFRFTGPLETDDAKPIWKAVELMRTVLARRPARETEALRPTGRVLRDFYMALRAGNAASAEAHLRFLAEHGRLDPLNVLFLRVQALAELGDWAELLGRPELPDLLQVRRPVAVSEALMRAVYHAELERFEGAAAVEDAMGHFRSSVLPRYGTLLTRRAGIRAPAAVKLLMLRAVAGEPADPGARDALLATPGLSHSDLLYLRLVAEQLQDSRRSAHGDPLAIAAEALAVGDFDRAFALLADESPSVRRARGLLECAYELQTLAVERAAIEAIEALDENGRAEALRGRLHQGTYDRIIGSWPTRSFPPPADGVEPSEPEPDDPRPVAMGAGAPVEIVPSNWVEWLDRLAAEPGWERAIDVARRGATEWSVEELLALPAGAAMLAGRLASARDSATLQLALPHVIAFYQRDAEWPRAELAAAYLWTLEQLAMGSRGGVDDLAAFHELAQAVLSVGAGVAEYERLTDSAELLSDDAASYHSVGWALDLLDLMVVHPCPRPDLRVRVLARVSALFRRYWMRLDESQWEMLRTLCDELGQRDVFQALSASGETPARSEASTIDAFGALRGRSVAVYTLTERAGRRLAEILERRAPGVSIQLSHEKVGSDSLRHLARHADVFIVATASAKHAATGFIDAHRPRDLPTLRPAGKGTASMLRALLDHLRDVGAVGTRAA